MGTPEFACHPLATLADSRHDVAAVVTGPDKPVGRGRKLTPTPVARLAEQLNLPVLKPASLKDAKLHERVRQIDPDLLVVVAFRILPKSLYSIPKQGAINVHGSLLPKYRGAAPIQWALINGETTTGLSSFFLKKEVDTGDVILQQEITIEDSDTYDSLAERMSRLAGPFLLNTLDTIENGSAEALSQDDSKASPAPKISPEDALIDFGFPAERVVNFVRGLSSQPGAYTWHDGKILKVLAATIADDASSPDTRPGTIIVAKKRLVVQCARSAVELQTVVPQGKKQMDGPAYINGYRPNVGDVLGEPYTTQQEKS